MGIMETVLRQLRRGITLGHGRQPDSTLAISVRLEPLRMLLVLLAGAAESDSFVWRLLLVSTLIKPSSALQTYERKRQALTKVVV